MSFMESTKLRRKSGMWDGSSWGSLSQDIRHAVRASAQFAAPSAMPVLAEGSHTFAKGVQKKSISVVRGLPGS
jgi:hypothetical protein